MPGLREFKIRTTRSQERQRPLVATHARIALPESGEGRRAFGVMIFTRLHPSFGVQPTHLASATRGSSVRVRSLSGSSGNRWLRAKHIKRFPDSFENQSSGLGHAGADVCSPVAGLVVRLRRTPLAGNAMARMLGEQPRTAVSTGWRLHTLDRTRHALMNRTRSRVPRFESRQELTKRADDELRAFPYILPAKPRADATVSGSSGVDRTCCSPFDRPPTVGILERRHCEADGIFPSLPKRHVMVGNPGTSRPKIRRERL